MVGIMEWEDHGGHHGVGAMVNIIQLEDHGGHHGAELGSGCTPWGWETMVDQEEED